MTSMGIVLDHRMIFNIFTLILNMGFMSTQENVNVSLSFFTVSSLDMISCSSLNNTTSSENTDKIYRLPPPGGTHVPDQIRLPLRASYLIIRYLFRVSIVNNASIDVTFDIDYDSMVGLNRSYFQYLLYCDLRENFYPSGLEVRNLLVQKGSVKISYEVTRAAKNRGFALNCDNRVKSSKNFRKRYQPCGSKLSSLSSTSATKPKLELDSTFSSSEVTDFGKVRRFQKRAVPNTRSSMRLAVHFTIDVDYPAVAKGRVDELKRYLLRQLARQIRVPTSSIQDFDVQKGMKISFVLVPVEDENNVMDERTVIEATDDLRSRLDNKQLRLTDLEGRPMSITNDRLIISHDEPSTLSLVILGVLILVLIMLLCLVVLAGYAAKTYRTLSKPLTTIISGNRKKSKKSKAYRHMATQDTGRDSSTSSGRYSYDSGLWVGPGPEPIYTVPDAPFYRPPTVEQLSSTPRPTTSLRTRLKTHWNIDPEQTLPPIPDGVENSRDENARHHRQYQRRLSRDNNRFHHAPTRENETYS